MRKLLLALLMGLALLWPRAAFGWPAEACPEGHIESNSYSAIQDGEVFIAATTTISAIYGTAHKGPGPGASQADANLVLDRFELYLWWDRDKDGTADADDEPVGHTHLSANIANNTITIPVESTIFFRSTGFIKIDTELIRYTSKTATSLICSGVSDRGYNETSATSHLSADSVTAVNAWELVHSLTTDGSPYNAVGYDATTQGSDDGTEGDLLQGSLVIVVVEGRWYLAKIHIVDDNGNTNTEVEGVDKLFSYGEDCYLDGNGDAGQGLEDDEVVNLRVNMKPLRIFRW